MTPDDVVARARELVGQEVLLTVRGRITNGQVTTWATTACGVSIPLADLVGIQPAPLRIEPGQLYADAENEVYRGNPDGSLAAFGIKGKTNPDQVEGLRLLKVVDA